MSLFGNDPNAPASKGPEDEKPKAHESLRDHLRETHEHLKETGEHLGEHLKEKGEHLKEKLKDVHDRYEEIPPAKRRGFWRWVGIVSGSLLALLVLMLGVATWYTGTNDFQHRVGREVKEVLEDSTGGRVDVGHIGFSLWHLAIEVDGLVIHGTEPAGEMPYLSADKILLRLRINTFISHTVGKGPQTHVGLNFLRVEQPHVHLIVNKDGTTNQPTPKHPTPSTEPVQNTLLDLQAGDVQLANGLAVINDKSIPFDMAAHDLAAEVKYLPQTDHYGATVDLNDLRTRISKQPEVQSQLHITAELGRDMFALNKVDFTTARNTHLSANVFLRDFAKPVWQASANGSVDLKQLGLLAGIDGFSAGSVELDVSGHSCDVTPQEAQTKPHFWQRSHKTSPAAKALPPSPDCQKGYLLVGGVKAHRVAYRIPQVRFHDVDAVAQLHVTPEELLFNSITSTLPGGGRIAGDMKIENWLGEVLPDSPVASATTVASEKVANNAAKSIGAKAPVDNVKAVKRKDVSPKTAAATAAPVTGTHTYITVKVQGISLRTIMDITAPEHYGDLGLDTSIAGPVEVEWGGPATNVADTVKVDADLAFTPTGKQTRGRQNIPVSGHVVGHYDGANETVKITSVNLQTPSTTLDANGILGVNKGDPLTQLALNLQARDLSEFDSVLQTLGFENNGKKGSAAIPVALHGALNFNGSAHGAVRNLDVKGHLSADNFEAASGTTADVHIDSLVADAEYSPNSGLAVGSSTIKRNTAVLEVAGTYRPRKVVSRRGLVSYVWDDGGDINTNLKLDTAQAADLLDIAGQKGKIPLTGTVAANAHAAGTLKTLAGGGEVTLKNGSAYGESYQNLDVIFTMAGPQIDASHLLVQAYDMSVSGSGSYNYETKHITAQLAGSNMQLAKLAAVRNAGADGVLTFNADANGTLQEPNLHAKLSLAKLIYQGKALGDLNATAYSTKSIVYYDVHSNALGAQLVANGQTALTGNFDTSAKLTLADLDIANAIALFAPGSVKATSKISGTITVNGPATQPKQLVGNIELNLADIMVQGIDLKTAEPLRASLRNGTLTIDQLHITGRDTDLRAGGSAVLFGDPNPKGGTLSINAGGAINMGLAHVFDQDLITSGKVIFNVGANGRLLAPELNGKVQFQNVNLAIDGIPNGLSSMNGTLVFNENRLDVQSLTGRSGGGDLKIGGSIYYQKGLVADLTATGDNVRVRYNGLSATANANFRLQGGPQSLLFSGNVLITRFNVGPDVDFAGFAGAGGVELPPDPTSAANKVRLDVRITSSPQLDFQNSYAKLAGTVDLTVRGTTAVPSILGRIQITEGSATFAGTKYQLDRGTIYFSNPVRIDPIIDLTASARVENYDITIGLNGTMTNLKPTYRSEPPLTEADIFNLLALGRTQEEAQLYQEQQVQAGTDPTTSALLGGALNATVSSRVGKLFGAGSVKIDPAFVGTLGNSSARITVQEPLSKQLTLVFATNVNQTAQQLIQVQWQVSENRSIVATRDESGVFSIVYKIRKRYR
ncbi:translocation and assembly module TamB [Bryocella elongata]|uniref:Translocation and assembly module TamB n=1 Tax=Bryocella elongata TaxID=863522 RepID=A0A1H5W211_9BACT|nr:translocation/assembly module TamB domain-containing protein [Bryocella elongata]SEF93490.1 translocation and assembly module TamB [Bryocella elongata]